VPNVTLTLAGDAGGSTLSDSSGNYLFSSLPFGGNYTVTPTTAALAPGTAGIDTVDAIAVQRHALNVVLLPPGRCLRSGGATSSPDCSSNCWPWLTNSCCLSSVPGSEPSLRHRARRTGSRWWLPPPKQGGS
jgi:hypothetical protein